VIERLYESEYFVAIRDPKPNLLRVTRTRVAFHSVAEAEKEFFRLAKVFDGAPREGTRLLLDVREGPHRNDPEYEAMLARTRTRMFEGFEKSVILMKTATGILQARWMEKTQNAWIPVAMTEADAMKLLGY
jgi:hypothetical protein